MVAKVKTQTSKSQRAKEESLIDSLKAVLPPVIARKEVRYFLGGMVASQTLANADKAGVGPEEAYRVGNAIVYPTDSLLKWIVGKYGITPLATFKNL